MEKRQSNSTGVKARNQFKLMAFFGEIMEFVLQHGQGGLDAMEDLNQEQHAQMLDELVELGLLEKVSGRYSLTVKAVQAAENRALALAAAKLVEPVHKGNSPSDADASTSERARSHSRLNDEPGTESGPGPEPGHGPNIGAAPPQVQGPPTVLNHPGLAEPMPEADLTAALKRAISRTGAGSCPLGAGEPDLNAYLGQCQAPASVAILLDMSGSMARFGRFLEAKKVAMAVHALARQRFTEDSVETIGFYSLAEPISENRLPLLMPKPLGGHLGRMVQRIPLSQARQGPHHFSNLQMGLRLAGEALAGRPGNKLVFIITDGHPTAHIDGRNLVLIYPPDERTALATLAEAKTLAEAGVRLATFALIGESEGFDWVGFVEQLTRTTRGVSFYCGNDDLAGCVLETYLCGKMKSRV